VGDFVSSGGKVGRVNVADEYVKALLTTKIVVVAQRDNWEDHYRLFEAYAGGSMVMSDTMLSLPDGLVDGESIVIYNSLDELRSQILYYLEHEDKRLEIARRGFEIAIKQHRSYHWMEKIFFGKQLTP
jgi:spore maturation protein CgeB